MIVSTLSGRIRIRAKRLKSLNFSDQVKESIESFEGVTEVRANPSAGSIIVSFNPKQADVDELEERIEKSCYSADRNKKRKDKRLRNIETIGLMTTLAGTVAFGVLGRKRVHIAFSAAFLAFGSLHLKRQSNRILH